MNKSRKAKLLNYLLPLATVGLAPVAILSASCQNNAASNDQLEKIKRELEQKEQELRKKNEKIEQLEKEKKENEEATPQNDNAVEVEVSAHNFKNFNQEYTIQEKNDVNAYKIKDDKSKVVYVDLDEFLKVLDGLVDLKLYSSYIDEVKNRKVYLSKDKNGETLNKLIVDWKENKIFTTNTSFFHEILKPQELTDGNQFLEIDYESKNEDDKGVSFDLGKYHMDILYKDGKLLLPFSVFNTLFMSQTFNNIYFNGKTFTNLEAGLDSWGSIEDEPRTRIRHDSGLSGQKATVEERKANFDHLAFTMDYFYGLKYYKQIESFESFISAEDRAKLLSTDPEQYNKAYVNIFHKQLNELHTRLNSFSYYETQWDQELEEKLRYPNDYGKYRIDFENNRKMLVDKFEKKFGKKISNFGPDDYIRYHGNTAIVTLLQFEDGTQENIQGPDAWKYDTYFLMRHLMSEVSKKPEIKNIVLDIAINGGGSVNSMIRTLGFMTDKPILNREFDILNRRGDLSKSKVDTDGDNNYDGDAYEKYNWNLLVSLNTFSAANQLTSIVKEMGIAKIIGKKTGGGMSAIMPITLIDGTTITISSPNNAVFGETNKEIESGVEPDINLEYDDFYNDEKINEVLEKAKTNQSA
ncbi:S41 family peptidase [Mycoplasmopsis arginini]|uniref:S41 family peptidase n=1 Tax=Mycoplasmopsis arginini TaxID=2094 RepID=UPI00249E2E88|nr:S41 family peptidase [Mycoplasmopsis arginini]MDI3351607.1 lipoprotein [Mycoplasmopsis arginini]MDI3352126.1 lipoprotein [Mycoplasmopsis arginini]